MSASLLDWYPGDHAAGFVLIVLGQTAILAAVALLVSSRLRRNAAARHVVLLSALVSVAICPAVTYVFDVAEVSLGIIPGRLDVDSPVQPVSQPTAAPQETSTEVVAEIIEEPSPSGPQDSSGGPSVGSPVARIDGTGTRESSLLEKLRAAFVLGFVAWAGVALVRCAGIARSWWKTHSIARAARSVANQNLARLSEELRRRLGIRRLPTIASSSAVSVPVAAGLVHPVIIVPSAIRDRLSEDQWRDVLVHETAHVLRHDHLLALVQRVIGAVYWINPLIHVLNRRLSRAREEVCDNYVLSFTAPRSYGKTLLGLAELIPQAGRSAVSPGLLGVRWTLEERISGLLDPRRNAMTRTTTYTAALVLGAHLSGVALLAAAGTAKATDLGAEEPAADARQSGERAEPASHADTDWQSVEARIARDKRTRRIESELNLPTSLQMENEPLWRLRAEIESFHELKVRLGFLNEDERVTINTAKGGRLRDALRPLNLGFRVDGDEVVMAPLRSIELRDFGETKPVSHWVDALKDDNPHMRRRAAEILSALAGAPKDSIPSLVEAMKDPNALVRRWSARALGNFGTDAGPVVPPLINAIDDEAADVRSEAVLALGRIGAEAAVPVLIRVLRDEGSGLHREAVTALGDMGPKAADAVPALVETFQEPGHDDDLRAGAAAALTRIGSKGQSALLEVWAGQEELLRYRALDKVGHVGPVAVPLLTRLLEEEANDGLRSFARRKLYHLGAAARPAIPVLIRGLKDDWAPTRRSSAHALERIGPDAKPAVPALTQALEDPDKSVRANSAEALGAIGPEARSSLPALKKRLADENERVRAAAALAMGKIGADPKEVIRGLIIVLDSKDHRRRKEAARALKAYGPEAKDAVPGLIRAMREAEAGHDGCWLRQQAAQALGAIGPAAEDAIPVLVETSRNRDLCWEDSVRALGGIGPAAAPVLIELLGDADRSVRDAAASGLWSMEPGVEEALSPLVAAIRDPEAAMGMMPSALGRIGPPALPVLEEWLADADPRLRRAAAQGLGAMGPDASAAIPGLIEALNDEDWEVVWYAAAALGTVGAGTDRVVPHLVQMLRNGSSDERRPALIGLGSVGPAAKSALPDVVKALDDPEEHIRVEAAEAFTKIYTAARNG